jgi:leucyl-tRNA synthetase
MRLQNQGLIMASDGRKMSKRWGNVINPDDIVKTYGADTLRLYEMFMGPFDQSIAWNTDSIMGARRFIEKVWRLQYRAVKKMKGKNTELEKALHKTVKKVSEDIETMSFNTAISSMMILVNEMEKSADIAVEDFKMFLQILAPFAPHITEDIWKSFGEKKSIHISEWPKHDKKKIIDDTFTLVVQVNGKVRAQITAPMDADEMAIRTLALADTNVKNWVGSATIKKFIYVKGKLASIVI